LRPPYTFVAAAILIAILGGIVIAKMPTDLLPDISIPVVSAISQYRGLSVEEREKRITLQQGLRRSQKSGHTRSLQNRPKEAAQNA
jgi:multidrug efflux pump subunit AcrB